MITAEKHLAQICTVISKPMSVPYLNFLEMVSGTCFLLGAFLFSADPHH